jgi:hypothetical protein
MAPSTALPCAPLRRRHVLHENFNISNIEFKIIDFNCRRRPVVSPRETAIKRNERYQLIAYSTKIMAVRGGWATDGKCKKVKWVNVKVGTHSKTTSFHLF